MRIGLIIYGSLDTISGGYLYDRVMVEYLRAQGDSVQVISLPNRGYRKNLRDNWDSVLLQLLKDAPLDVLIEDEMNHPSLFWLNRKLKRRARYPIISLVHLLKFTEVRPAWQNALYKIVERMYLKGVDGLIYNSQTTQRDVEAVIGTQKRSVVAYPAGDRFGALSEDAIRERTGHIGALRILCVGNVIRRKGLHTLIDALVQLPAGSWHLDVIGMLTFEPDYVAEIRQQIDRLNLGESISVIGALTGDALIERFAQSDVFALPSTYEGFGIAYLEAMAFGLPTIGTTAGAAHELIADLVSGFLVSPDDPAALADRLRRLAEDRALLREMSLAARQRFDAHPTWSQSMGTVREFLRSMVKTSKRK